MTKDDLGVFAAWLVILALAPGFGVAPEAQRRDGSGEQPALGSILERYRQLDREGAIREFATWNPSRVFAESTATSEGLKDPYALAALALLHSETGIATDSFGTLRPGLGLISGRIEDFDVHFVQAFHLVDKVFATAERLGDAQLLDFCQKWYFIANRYKIAGAVDPVLGRLQARFLDAAGTHLLTGIHAEYWMGPQIDEPPVGVAIGPPPHFSTPHGVFGRYSGEAQAAFRKALELDPGIVEARLRLGRVLYLLDRTDDARKELERALEEAEKLNDRHVTYLAALFLGRLLEDADQTELAEARYLDALAAMPTGQSARLAIGRLRILEGRSEEGWTTIGGILDETHDRQEDPWHHYRYDQLPWNGTERIRVLRNLVLQ